MYSKHAVHHFYILYRYENVLPFVSAVEQNQLEEDYQLMEQKEIPE